MSKSCIMLTNGVSKRECSVFFGSWLKSDVSLCILVLRLEKAMYPLTLRQTAKKIHFCLVKFIWRLFEYMQVCRP